MTPLKFSSTIQKIHEAFYGAKLSVLETSKHEVQLKYKNEVFGVENHIETRYRVIFPDYDGKIGAYRNLFGYILGNDDNVCDTSDFIDLPRSHVQKIHDWVTQKKLNELQEMKNL